MTRRLSEGWRHWKARMSQLCNRRLPFKLRLRRLVQTVYRTVTHGSGGWVLTKSLVEQIISFESRILRSMGGRKTTGDSWAHFFQEGTRDLRRELTRAGLPSLLQLVIQSMWRWWGHCLRGFEPSRKVPYKTHIRNSIGLEFEQMSLIATPKRESYSRGGAGTGKNLLN